MLSGQKRYVFEVTEADFQARVLERSREVPVIVDFWAPWCGPCKTIGPFLEELAKEFAGAFELAKVNVDDNPRLATMLRIQSIPTLFAFVDGQPVDGFTGAQPPAAIRKFIERVAPAPEQDPLEVGDKALAEGHLDVAERAFRQVLDKQPKHGAALVGMARIALNRREIPRAAGFLDAVPPEDAAHAQAERLKGFLTFGEDAGDEAELRRRLELDPSDTAARYALGATLALNGRTAEATEVFLEIVKRDRAYREDAGRKALLTLFDLSGPDDPQVITARRRLASLLF